MPKLDELKAEDINKAGEAYKASMHQLNCMTIMAGQGDFEAAEAARDASTAYYEAALDYIILSFQRK